MHAEHPFIAASWRRQARRLQSLYLLLNRRWAQMEAPPQSLQMLLRRLCSQMEAPPQSLHALLCRLRSQRGRLGGVVPFAVGRLVTKLVNVGRGSAKG